MRGVIEGFYGTPWSWAERTEVCRALAGAGMDTYLYAPKDDPLHRTEWRTLYPPDALDGFARLADEQPLRVGFSVAPGLSLDPDSSEDRAALLAKFCQLTDRGVTLVGLLFDDLDPAPGLGTMHGQVTAWLRDRLPDHVELLMVPLHYTGVTGSDYLDELAAVVPFEVPIGWTGRYVVNDAITAEEARQWSRVMGGRRPLLWDNTPVNDAIMTAQLFTGPLRGRDPELPAQLSGYLANPMVQARASVAPLLSAAAWLAGEDPVAAWRAALGGDRILMEACDGEVPNLLAAAGLGGDDDALAELEAWFGAAEACGTGGLGESVQPWVDRLHEEARVGKLACQLLRADPAESAQLAPILYLMWPVRPGAVQVLGGSGSLVPALGQDARSGWVASASSFRRGAHLVDRLVEAVFGRLA